MAEEKKCKAGKVMNICQYEFNPRTGEKVWDNPEESIATALDKHKSIKKWAWVCHDEDVYTEEEEKKNVEFLQNEYDRLSQKDQTPPEAKEEYVKKNQWIFAGKKKPNHWHIVLWFENKRTVDMVAGWFGVAPQYVDVPKSRKGHSAESAMLDCVQYLTHEDDRQQDAGKHLYPDDAVHSNFDWRAALNERKELAEKYGREFLTPKEKLRMEVLDKGLSIKQALEEDKITAADDLAKLEKLRGVYLSRYAPMPDVRVNIYVSGSGGMGKLVVSKLLAEFLYPDLPEDERLFICGKDTGFNGYDGQPVILYDDIRGYEMIKSFGGRGNVFNMLDTHPSNISQNVKYSTTVPINAISIINSVEPYPRFLHDFDGKHYDKEKNEIVDETENGQIERRVPIALELGKKTFRIWINKGFFDGKKEDMEVTEFVMEVAGNFGDLIKNCKGDEFKRLGRLMLEPVLQKIEEAKKIERPADRPAVDCSYYGTRVNDLLRGHYNMTPEELHTIEKKLIDNGIIDQPIGKKILPS